MLFSIDEVILNGIQGYKEPERVLPKLLGRGVRSTFQKPYFTPYEVENLIIIIYLPFLNTVCIPPSFQRDVAANMRK